ncbi:MAG: glycosyltransferase family 4 protein [Shewanella sp.]
MKHYHKHKIVILYIHYSESWSYGSEQSLVTLINQLDKDIYEPIVWTNQPKLVTQLQLLGICTQFDEHCLFNPWYTPRLGLRLRYRQYQACCQLINQYLVDLIHCNSAGPLQWAILAAHTMNIPIIYHLHSRFPTRGKLALGVYLCPVIVGVNQVVNDALIHDGYPQSCTELIYNGIDTKQLLAQPGKDMRAEFNLKPQDILLASIASQNPHQSIDKLITITASLRRQGYPVQLLILGAAKMSALQAHAQSLNVSEQVHFIAEPTQVVSYLKGGVDIYLAGPDEEVFGLSLIEAQLMGLSVVAPNIGGIAEVIISGQTGLITTTELEDVSAAIERLISQPSFRRHLGKCGAERVLYHFNSHYFYQQFSDLYQKLIFEHGQFDNPYLLQKMRALAKASLKFAGRLIVNKLTRKTTQRRVFK